MVVFFNKQRVVLCWTWEFTFMPWNCVSSRLYFIILYYVISSVQQRTNRSVDVVRRLNQNCKLYHIGAQYSLRLIWWASSAMLLWQNHSQTSDIFVFVWHSIFFPMDGTGTSPLNFCTLLHIWHRVVICFGLKSILLFGFFPCLFIGIRRGWSVGGCIAGWLLDSLDIRYRSEIMAFRFENFLFLLLGLWFLILPYGKISPV